MRDNIRYHRFEIYGNTVIVLGFIVIRWTLIVAGAAFESCSRYKSCYRVFDESVGLIA